MKTYGQLVQHVQEIAAANPNARYLRVGGKCRYNSGEACDGEVLLPGCGCLIGRGLQTMGVDCARLDEEMPGQSVSQIYRRLDGDYDFRDRGNHLSWLGDVQFKQDIGATWAEAIDYADSRRPTCV